MKPVKHPRIIRNKKNPEWGDFSVRLEPRGEWYEISGRGGSCILHFGELQFWDVLMWWETPQA